MEARAEDAHMLGNPNKTKHYESTNNWKFIYVWEECLLSRQPLYLSSIILISLAAMLYALTWGEATVNSLEFISEQILLGKLSI